MIKICYICTIFTHMKVKKFGMIILVFCLGLLGCQQQAKDKELLHRDFHNTVWERFDYVTNEVEINASTTYDLSLKISFTDDYPYDNFSMIFTVFDERENPYRSKEYKFNLKDGEGHWNAEKEDGFIIMTGKTYWPDNEDIEGRTFTATAEPYKYNGKHTWVIVSLETD